MSLALPRPPVRESRSAGRRRKKTASPTTVDEGPRDYVRIALEFAHDAIGDTARQRHGKWVRLAAKRFVDDLARCKEKRPPFTFDRWHAHDACDFIEKLPHIEGKWSSPTIRLHPAHVFFVVALFGFRKADGTRRFTTALLAIARKNAKSTLAAAILLYCLCCEDEPGAQVITAAMTGSQARIVFSVAKKMIEQTPDLREAFDVEAFANAIARWQSGASFKPINAKASTQDGLNPSHTVFDEIHAQKTHDLLNVLQSAAGARSNPLWLYTTTEGYETPGPWPELRTFTQNILEGMVKADHFLGIIFALDDIEGEPDKPGYYAGDDDFDESKWVKANPLLEVNPVLLVKIREAALEAQQMPGRLAEFRIKRLNRRSSTAQGWVRFGPWKACGGAVDLDWLAQFPCVGGLDLASTTDLTAFRLVWLVEDVYYTWGRRWVPERAVRQRTVRGTVPYAAWVQAGLIEQCPGEVNDHDIIADAIREADQRFKIERIGYDRWNADQLVKDLKDGGIEMVEVAQGPATYNPAMKRFERAYLAGNLRHGGDPVLTWCASNLVARHDVNLNMAPDRKKSGDKIDDMVALLECFVMLGDEVGKSFWDQEEAPS